MFNARGTAQLETVNEDTAHSDDVKAADGVRTECPQKPQRPSTLGLVYMNAHSLKSATRSHNKLEELDTIVADFSPDIVVVTETWLNDMIFDSEILPADFVIHRKDRAETCPDKRGGGVLIGVRESVFSSRRRDLEPNAEIIVCELKPHRHAKIALIGCYRPPGSDVTVFTNHMKDVLFNASKEFEYLSVVGDFNFPGVDWKSLLPPDASIPGTAAFLEVLNTFSLVQINEIASNVHGNILDLILTNAPELFCDVSKLPCDLTSDHVVLYTELYLRKHPKKRFDRSVFNYKLADFNTIRNHLNAASLCDIIRNSDNVNSAWVTWLDTVNVIVEQCVPTVVIKDSTAPPWADSEIRHLRNLKRTAWRKARRTNEWANFRKLRNKLKKVTRIKKRAFIDNLGDECTVNPKRFWSYYRSKTKSKSLPHSVKNESNEAQEPNAKANMFNDYFYSAFNNNVSPELPVINEFVDCNLSTIRFNSNHVLAKLKGLDITKACGPDKLSPRVLRECCTELAPSLTLLYNRSMQSGVIPKQWREANVVPVHKKGAKECVGNYRPISLLCIASKIMERCIHDHVFTAVKAHIHPLQHGFMKGRSCATQLLNVYHDVGSNLDSGGQTDIVFLDFSKAFDSVSHVLLLHKLKMYGFNGALLNWLRAYLSDRRQRVLIEGSASMWLPVTSGVPQGSILGPLLFLLYINDMPSVTSSSETALFADDAKCLKRIFSQADSRALQDDLNRLHEWSTVWSLTFNVEKCKVLTISRSRSPVKFDYSLDGVLLENVGSFKDLGIVIDSSLSFREHTRLLIGKANATAGMIKRTMGYHAPCRATLQLYSALTRSQFEYCSPVWSPFLNCDIKRIESVQRSMTRYILGYPESLTYRERCIDLNLMPLSYRREISDLVFLFKCMHDVYDVNFNDNFNFVTTQSRLRSADNGILLRGNLVSTECFKHSYFNRVTRMWNRLPRNMRDCEDLNVFKDGVSNFYFNKLLTEYDIDNSCTWSSTCRCQLCSCIANY